MSRRDSRGLTPFALRGLAAGAGGGLAMAASTALEMRVRGRAASGVPADVLARVAPRRAADRLREDERLRTAISWASPWPTALAAGLVREAIAAAGVGEPGATAAFFALACLPDVAIAPLAGAAEPPWRWGAAELAISLGHHAVFAVAASAVRAAAAAGPAR